MKHIKAMLLGAALMAGTTTLAVAQSVVPVQWGWGQRDNDDRQAFRDGFNQGQQDARHNRRFNPETAAGVSATTEKHSAQDTSAASSKTAATTMAAGAGTAMGIGTATEIGTGMATAIAESMAAATEVTADTEGMRRSSTDIRMESTMASVTGAAATAIVRRRTATTNTPTMATAQLTATEITTNKLTARRTKMDINRDTTAAAAGADTNSTDI